MADGSKIEWLARPGTKPATWNPIKARRPVTGATVGFHCEHVSEACRNCYAENGFNKRFGTGMPYTRPSRDSVDIFLDETTLTKPLHWCAPRTIFVCSTTDLFGEWVKDEWLDRIFAVAALCPQHTFIILTKRPERMRDYINSIQKDGRWLEMEGITLELGRDPRGADNDGFDWLANHQFLPNIWLGVTAESQKTADERIPLLLETPAAIRFVSCEPMIGLIDLTLDSLVCLPCPHCIDASPEWDTGVIECRRCDSSGKGDEWGIDLVICGGESGPNARPMHPEWARSLRDQCATAEVPFFFKQWGEWACVYDRQREDLDWRRCSDIKRKTPNGLWHNLAGGQGFHGEWVVRMDRVGKKRAGRLLDGVEHNAWPEVIR